MMLQKQAEFYITACCTQYIAIRETDFFMKILWRDRKCYFLVLRWARGNRKFCYNSNNFKFWIPAKAFNRSNDSRLKISQQQ